MIHNHRAETAKARTIQFEQYLNIMIQAPIKKIFLKFNPLREKKLFISLEINNF